MGFKGEEGFAPTAWILRMVEALPDTVPGDLTGGVDNFLKHNKERLLGKHFSPQRIVTT